MENELSNNECHFNKVAQEKEDCFLNSISDASGRTPNNPRAISVCFLILNMSLTLSKARSPAGNDRSSEGPQVK